MPSLRRLSGYGAFALTPTLMCDENNHVSLGEIMKCDLKLRNVIVLGCYAATAWPRSLETFRVFFEATDVCVLPVNPLFQPLPVFFVLFQLFLPDLHLFCRHSLQEPSLAHGLGLQDEAESHLHILTGCCWSCCLELLNWKPVFPQGCGDAHCSSLSKWEILETHDTNYSRIQ